MNHIKIEGVGYALGDLSVDNKMFESILDTNDEWITSRTGISKRTISTKKNTSDLAVEAALMALSDAQCLSKDIDAIIVATMTPDFITPATAPLVQEKLNMNDQRCVAFDVNGACSGFVYALQIAASMIKAKQSNRVLVIGAETFSKIMDYNDRSTSVLFGDGAGAVVVSKGEAHNTMHFYTQSKGDTEQQLFVKGLDLRDGLKNKNQQVGYLQMKGLDVFRFASFAIVDAIDEIVKKANIKQKDIDLIIPHQANIRIIQHASKLLNIPMNVFYTNLDEVGNTSAASIPLALAQAKENGLLKDKKHIVLVGFGAGLTWGAVHVGL